jgi:Fic family protein
MNVTVKRFINELKAFKETGIPDAINYAAQNQILISHHSTAMEGSSLTEDETRLLLTEGLTAKGKPLHAHNMIRDHHRALLHIIEWAEKKQPVTVEFIRRLSAMVMQTTGGIINAAGDSYDSSAGDFRMSMVYVGNRYFQDYRKVPESVRQLCLRINERIDGITTTEQIYNLAFDAHFELVGIHPFADGNGRVSRLLMNCILACHHQPLAIVFSEDRADYFKVLEKARETENMLPFRDFMYK